jgi:hypothetical protein
MNIRQIPQRARRMALSATVVACIALAPSAAQGQDPQRQDPPTGERMDPRQVIDQRMATMTETLKLDSAQQTKIRSIIADETMEMEALRKNAGGQRAGTGGERGGRGGGRGGGRRGSAPPESTGGGEGRGDSGGQSPEARAIRDRTNKQIEGVLNAQQLTTYRQLFELQQQQRPTGDTASRRAVPRPESRQSSKALLHQQDAEVLAGEGCGIARVQYVNAGDAPK